MSAIPLTRATISGKEIKAATDVLKSGWLIRGPQTSAFEEEFAKFVGARHAVATNGCTMALYLAVKEMNLQPTDEVIVPSLTWSATASIVVQAGARPVFADVDPVTWCLDPNDVKRRITKNTKLVIPVHFAGRFAEGFEDFSVPVLYDSAHRIIKNDFRGVVSCFSFYAVKNMTTVRGGMIVTDDDAKAAWYRKAVHGGMGKDTRSRYVGQRKKADASDFYYEVEFPGWNFDMTDVEAAIGRAQLGALPRFNKKRNAIVQRYNQAFGLSNTGNHLYPILVENRDELLLVLRVAGIQAGLHYLPLHAMRGYQAYANRESLSVTEFIGARCVSLPLFAGMTQSQVKRVITMVKKHARFTHRTMVQTGSLPRKLPTVTIGIPAHNESGTIASLVESILSQKQDRFVLEKILVVCDGCTDSTEEIARALSFKYTLVRVVAGKRRLGKTARLNQIYTKNRSDFLLTLDGDIVLGSDTDIEKMLNPFLNDERIVLVGGRIVPIRPQRGFIAKALYANYVLWNETTNTINGGDHVHNLHGPASMLRGSFARSVRYPTNITCDEGFLYALAKQHGGFQFVPDTRVLLRPIASLSDARIGASRFLNERYDLPDHFGKDVLELYKVPFLAKVRGVMRTAVRHPLGILGALAYNVWMKLMFRRTYGLGTGVWIQTLSTKHDE